MITIEQKREIIDYVASNDSSELLESIGILDTAYENEEINRDEIDTFVNRMRQRLILAVNNGTL
jgi:hypothetical protein